MGITWQVENQSMKMKTGIMVSEPVQKLLLDQEMQSEKKRFVMKIFTDFLFLFDVVFLIRDFCKLWV